MEVCQIHAVRIERSDKSGPNAVYGRDGLTNLIKYALGLAPKQDATSGLPTLMIDSSDWVFTYIRPAAATDIAYSVEISTDLVNWTDLPP